MRIAIVGSAVTIIPPDGQASVERLAYYQAMGLAKRGHEVTLFAPTGSNIANEHIHLVELGPSMRATPSNIGDKKPEEIYGAAYTTRARMSNIARLLEYLLEHQKDFDVILNNSFDEAPILELAGIIKIPCFHIMHVPIIPQAADVFRQKHTRLIPISNAQRRAFTDLNYFQTVYNCVDTDEFVFSSNPGNYLLYLGSIGRNKNPHDAVLAAKESGQLLKIGGKLKDRAYYEEAIAPYVDGKQIIWVGELHPKEVVTLYQDAKAFIFPTLWEEPFGLVAIEALSCGTPVIAYPNGGLVEIIKNGVNGFLVKDRQEMVEKIKLLDQIDRNACRKSVIERFSVDHMVEGYEAVLMNAV